MIQSEIIIKKAYQLCETLDTVNSKGIVHRDIKPSNILYIQK